MLGQVLRQVNVILTLVVNPGGIPIKNRAALHRLTPCCGKLTDVTRYIWRFVIPTGDAVCQRY
jgi:hypothetical protein